jgi:outer membrane protein assembly factor BamA
VSSFGTGVGGSISAYYSDILGYHNIGVTFQGGGSSGVGTIGDQLAGEVFYLNQRHRLNWGVDTTHLPYVSAFTTAGQAAITVDGQRVIADVVSQTRDIQRFDDVSGVVQYPFSQTRRIEFTGGFQHQSLKEETETVYFVGNTIVQDDTQRSPFNFSLSLGHAATAFVGDSSVFGFLSPVRGTRYRYELSGFSGDLKFQTALADYRKYFFFNPVTVAVRGIYYGRFGTDSESGRISPLYIGQDSLIHGYDINSIGPEECVFSGTTSCPVFDRLIGSKIGVANLEVRVPVVGTKQFGLISGFVPTELFGFLDAGGAWSSKQHLDVRFSRNNATDRVPVVSAGAGVRLLLAYIPLEFYAAKPFQRPTQKWVTGFNIIAGW